MPVAPSQRDVISQAIRDRSRMTYAKGFFYVLQEKARDLAGEKLSTDRYLYDPVLFAREVLGLRLWDFQVRFLHAIVEHDRVAVRSGHKIAKTATAAVASLWWYCRPAVDGVVPRVLFTAPTARQVRVVFWRELKIRKASDGICFDCRLHNESATSREELIYRPCVHSAIIPGYCAETPEAGIEGADYREIKGYTGKNSEDVAGFSGSQLLFLVDEASGVDGKVFETIEGNLAGGGKLILTGNPTKTTGDFFDAFHTKKDFYYCMAVSSEETPNAMYGDRDPRAIPGLANKKYVDEHKIMWGEDSPLYRVRIKGEFCDIGESRIFPVDLITSAEEKWHDADEEGRLFIGLDPARVATGDEAAWAVRRGYKILSIVVRPGMSDEGLIMQTVGMCNEYKSEREIPVLVFDREGKVGAELYGALQGYLAREADLGNPTPFELSPVRASDRAHRSPMIYDRMRDELAGNFFDWMQSGGSIPEDMKLSGEMAMLQWIETSSGRMKITPKKEIKKKIGRSTDRLDACMLAAWESASMAGTGRSGVREKDIEMEFEPDEEEISPYSYRD